MNITDEQSGKTKVTDPVVRGNFLPENPTQFDYLHAIRAIASRIGNKPIFDLADAGMNLVDAEATCSSSSDTPETNAATLRATDIEGGGEFDAVHVQVAKRLERERNAARPSHATACSAYEQAFKCWCFLGGRGTLVPESRTQFEEGLPIQVEPQDLIAFFEHNA